MSKALSRKVLPNGRPMVEPNLIELPNDYSTSINPDKVKSGLQTLGHVSHKVISPNLRLTQSRDLGYYRQTEAMFNVLRDNENLVHLSQTMDSTELLKCHGYNSVKDYLSSKKLEASTGMDT